MKRKIIGIFICTLLIATMAIPISALDKENNSTPKLTSTDVPVWNLGDSWTYDSRYYQSSTPDMSIDMVWDGSFELTLEVVDDTGDMYTLQGKAKPVQGTFDLSGKIDLKTSRFSSFVTTIKVYKSNLSIIDNEYLLKAILFLKIGPITIPIPIQIKTNMLTKFEPAFELLPFPLYDGKTGYTPKSTLNQTLEMNMFWGIIPVLSLSNNEGWVGNATYECTYESITIPSDTYDVYNITSSVKWSEYGEDWYRSYYCEDIGNIVKCAYNIDQDDGEPVVLWKMELLSTTYTP
jgi:hypothetical protein